MTGAFDEAAFGDQLGLVAEWETFHENSKTGRHQGPLSNEAVVGRMRSLYQVLPYVSRPRVALPNRVPLAMMLDEAIYSRRSAFGFSQRQIRLDEIATILELAYGVNPAGSAGDRRIRDCRNVPSAGALYPSELYVVAESISGLEIGLYHFNPLERSLVYIDASVNVRTIGRMFLQSDIIERSAAVVLITSIFNRAAFKYMERGYRFCLIESGHIGQNIGLVATALGLGVLNIGGYFDREVDAALSIDGLGQSTVYACALGGCESG
jgi:SagB-type dehydrogenase family enzyme